MKIAKSQLKQIIREELAEAIKIGGSGITMKPPTPEDKAFKKLREVMGLVEKAMLYMTGDEETGQNPTEVIEMVRNIVSESITEYGGAISNIGGRAGNLGAVAGRAEPPMENDVDSVIQAKALEFFMGLGLDQKVSQVMVDNVAIPDLEVVMDAIPKIDTADEVEDESLEEGNKAAKTVGDPPYRERGSTESQAQQKAAGMALSARRGDTAVSKLKGAALDLYQGEITTKELRNLAKLGQKVKQHKSKEPKHLKSLPGHATPAKD